MSHSQRFTSRKIAQRIAYIEPFVYRQRYSIAPFRFAKLSDCKQLPPIAKNVDDSNWSLVEHGTYWGGANLNFVMRTSFEVPQVWDKNCPAALYLPIGETNDGGFSHPEALAYIDELPYAACDRHHQEISLPDIYKDGKSHILVLHGWTGIGGFNTLKGINDGTKLLMQQCSVVQIDQATRDFLATARTALGIAETLDNNQLTKNLILNALDDSFKVLDMREPFGENFYKSVSESHTVLKKHLSKAGPALDIDIVATGHSHIDVAWLWTLGQTRLKAGRTFHTVLRLMEQFDNYHFTQSQPQLYDYVRQDYPQLFDEIKKRVREKRWEITGGMWIEADCNISGHESLARQFLLGRTFFREHFGPDVESPILWLPDVFGYSANLPQLIKQAGMEYFFTSKISWNQYNRLPYDSFWWQGIDGTKVLTHFATTQHTSENKISVYNANVTPSQVISTWTNFQQKEIHQQLLVAYGHGDGGGGPTREMLENIRELGNFPASPRIHQGSAHEFFKKLEASCTNRLPVWNGELYLELHRGTYTTQSRNKRANRKSEFLMHDIEFIGAVASFLDSNYTYPAAAIRKAWELICLNQFHDIIPGSSIGDVYIESLKDYEQIETLALAAKEQALAVIAKSSDGDIILINPTSFTRNEPSFYQGKLAAHQNLVRRDGQPVYAQPIAGGTLIDAGSVEPFSVTALTIGKVKNNKPENTLIVRPDLLENQCIQIKFTSAGDIISIYDKVNSRNILPPGALANQFQAFDDRPLHGEGGDAWDIDVFFEDKMWLSEPASSINVTETGPLRATIEVHRRILNSEYIQRISLTHNSPQIVIDTTIDWKEKRILLKSAFPVEILSPTAAYEIQWGYVERPTHRNTSWDMARFEVCAQKWIDLSEGNYGVSLLNDCKYGYDVKDNVMRISLLRGTTGPDPNADQCKHKFTYSLLLHSGNLGKTIASAYALNDPLIAIACSKPAVSVKRKDRMLSGFLKCDRPNIIIETIKKAEDSNGIIVRLYESLRERGTVTLTTGFGIKEAWQTNILEDNETKLEHSSNQIKLSIKPFEIVTLRLVAV